MTGMETSKIDRATNSKTSEAASSSDEVNFADHHFKSPAEKRRPKHAKKRKLKELENPCSKTTELKEQDINLVTQPAQKVKATERLGYDTETIDPSKKADIERKFQETRALYSISGDDYILTRTKNVTRDIIGFLSTKEKKLKYEDFLYEFPLGVGIPPEEIEDIPQEHLYWPGVHNYLKSNGNFTEEEAGKVIEKKVTFLLDYFRRFDEGRLTKEERRNGKIPPENFNGPYLPTPKHIKILQRLDIEVNWPLSLLHELCLRNRSFLIWRLEELKKIPKKFPRAKIRLGRVTDKEIQIVINNWIRFQKEYKFYDLRPLLGVKTGRVIETSKGFECAEYNYITQETRNKFLLYLMNGLPDRCTCQILRVLQDTFVYLQNNELKNDDENKKKYSLFEKYGLIYIWKKFGVNWMASELLLGEMARKHYKQFFFNHIYTQNIPMRRGPWLQQERRRLETGILTLLGVNTLKETVGMSIPWVKLLPFVRTRHVDSYCPQYKQMLSQKEVIKKITFSFSVEKQLIDSIYESGVEAFQQIDWEDIQKNIPTHTVRGLKQHFRYLMMKAPTFCKRDFVETIEYLYGQMDERYKIRHGLTGRTFNVDSTTEEEDLPDSSNMSMLSDTTFTNDLDDGDWSFVNDLFED